MHDRSDATSHASELTHDQCAGTHTQLAQRLLQMATAKGPACQATKHKMHKNTCTHALPCLSTHPCKVEPTHTHKHARGLEVGTAGGTPLAKYTSRPEAGQPATQPAFAVVQPLEVAGCICWMTQDNTVGKLPAKRAAGKLLTLPKRTVMCASQPGKHTQAHTAHSVLVLLHLAMQGRCRLGWQRPHVPRPYTQLSLKRPHDPSQESCRP